LIGQSNLFISFFIWPMDAARDTYIQKGMFRRDNAHDKALWDYGFKSLLGAVPLV
jgi:hypothetical protein